MMKLAFASMTVVAGAVLALTLSACAARAPGGGEAALRNGTVAQVEPVAVKSEQQLGLGTEVGISAGRLLGNQTGGGTRRDLVTVLAAIGGGPATSDEPERFASARDGQRVVVRLDNGVGIAVTQEAEPDLRVGDRVRVEGRGMQARVLLQP